MKASEVKKIIFEGVDEQGNKLIDIFDNHKKFRYGENPHQDGGLLTNSDFKGPSAFTGREYTADKTMSYNNGAEASSVLDMAIDMNTFFDGFGVVHSKHWNPSGAATAGTLKRAYKLSRQTDPMSAFGSEVCLTDTITYEVAELMNKHFVEVFIAPEITEESRELLLSKTNKKGEHYRRLIEVDQLNKPRSDYCMGLILPGGILIQDPDKGIFGFNQDGTAKTVDDLVNASGIPITASKKTFEFTYLTTKYLKSNCHGLAWEWAPGYFQMVAGGPGQPNRVESGTLLAIPREEAFFTRLYSEKMKHGETSLELEDFIAECKTDVVAGTDSFYVDGKIMKKLKEAGIRNVVVVSGSDSDEKVNQAAKENDIALIRPSIKDARHFNHAVG
jgi:phosphoribosylaminoimidazolecarboxamide formyltransferase / IMP cyclohydrolase